MRHHRLRIASPCPVSWDSMRGDDRVRHCSSCDKPVYNAVALTRRELDDLIAAHEGRALPCMQLHQRSDGRVMTRGCLTQARLAARRTSAWIRWAASVATAFVLACFAASTPASAAESDQAKPPAAKPKREKQPPPPKRPPPPPPPLGGAPVLID